MCTEAACWIRAHPSPADGGEKRRTATELKWRAPDRERVQVRIGSPNGDLLLEAGGEGSRVVEDVPDGATFLLQDAQLEDPTSDAATLASTTVDIDFGPVARGQSLLDAALDAWPQRVDQSYVIATLPRTGSTLLALGLWSTRRAGVPFEYFTHGTLPQLIGRWGTPGVRSHPLTECSADELERYTDALVHHRSPRGVFGVKVFALELERGVQPHQLLRSPRYVYLTRGEILEQAVSMCRAVQTGSWTEPIECVAEPYYSFAELVVILHFLRGMEHRWERYFDSHGIEPLRITYEDLCDDYAQCLRKVLNFTVPDGGEDATIGEPLLHKQAGAENRVWLARFARELVERRPSEKEIKDAAELISRRMNPATTPSRQS